MIVIYWDVLPGWKINDWSQENDCDSCESKSVSCQLGYFRSEGLTFKNLYSDN